MELILKRYSAIDNNQKMQHMKLIDSCDVAEEMIELLWENIFAYNRQLNCFWYVGDDIQGDRFLFTIKKYNDKKDGQEAFFVINVI